jgi:hypothetical protein
LDTQKEAGLTRFFPFAAADRVCGVGTYKSWTSVHKFNIMNLYLQGAGDEIR